MKFLLPFLLMVVGALAQITPPTNVVAGANVRLCWDANAETNLLVYHVYWGPRSRFQTNGVYQFRTNTVDTCISLRVTGATNYFAVTAMNRALLESEFSNEVMWFAPASKPPRTNVVIIAQKSRDLGKTWQEDFRRTNSIADTNALWRLRIE